MNRAEFYQHIEGLVEAPQGSVTGSQKLEELENWDSVTLVSFLALVDEQYQKKLSPRAVGSGETIDDLATVVENASSSV